MQHDQDQPNPDFDHPHDAEQSQDDDALIGSRSGATLSDEEGILDPEAALAFAKDIGTMLLSDKCEDVVILDVTRVSPITGFIVIGSGTSARQMRSALEHLGEVAQKHGTKTYHISEDDSAIWLLADFVDVVVHLFEPNARAHYDLEMLWGDAPRIEAPLPIRAPGEGRA